MNLFRRKVQRGKRLGRTIGFPTLNFKVGSFAERHSFGVYAATVWIDGKEYPGALHFGPKFGSRAKAHLEIHVPGFFKNIYEATVRFRVNKKIRNPRHFKTLEALKKQIEEDLTKID